MACYLFGAKPLPEPRLSHCQLDPYEQISVKFDQYTKFRSLKCIWKYRLRNGGHFVQGETNWKGPVMWAVGDIFVVWLTTVLNKRWICGWLTFGAINAHVRCCTYEKEEKSFFLFNVAEYSKIYGHRLSFNIIDRFNAYPSKLPHSMILWSNFVTHFVKCWDVFGKLERSLSESMLVYRQLDIEVPKTLRPRQNGHHFADELLKTFSWTKIYELWLTFHWSLVQRVQSTIFQHWFREWIGAGQCDKP